MFIPTSKDQKLNNALHKLYKGEWMHYPPINNSGMWRAEVEIMDINPLKILTNLSILTKNLSWDTNYWSDRNQNIEVTGIGTAKILTSQQSCSFISVCKQIQETLGNNRQRFYGGFSFSCQSKQNRNDKLWNLFGTYRFVLPRIEIIRFKNSTVLSCNYHLNESEILEQVLSGTYNLLNQALKNNLVDNKDKRYQIDSFSKVIHLPDFEQWKNLLKTILANLGKNLTAEDGPLLKVVLARRSSCSVNNTLSIYNLIYNLKKNDPQNFHFTMGLSNGTTFFGATPERLLNLRNKVVETEAIAGTRPRGKTAEEDNQLEKNLLSSEKDLREHQFVHSSIKQNLEGVCSKIFEQKRIKVKKLSNVQHLYTSFRGILKTTDSIGEILNLLHPTPAVGGYPKKGIVDFISNKEPFHRGWYAGPFGWVGINAAEFAVAIRSGLKNGNYLHLYAGNGIVQGSDPETEWSEMNYKIQKLLHAI